MPAVRYWWLGLCAVEVPPSPKVQAQLVTEPVVVSVKSTVSGAQPLVAEAVKAATGAGVAVAPTAACASIMP